MVRTTCLVGVMAAMMASAAWCAAPKTWELTPDSNWQAVDKPAAAPATQPAQTDATLDRAEELLNRHEHRAARRILLPWLKANPDHPLRDRALYLYAEAYYQYGDRMRAFYHLDELMDFHPDSPLYERALDKQYQIADEFLNGYKMRFLGIPMITGTDEAIEMLYRIQERAPRSAIAEKSLLRTADYYYADAQFDLASDAYGAYIRSYPRSELIPRVSLRQAFSAYAEFRGLRFDATPLVDARARLLDIEQRYPDLAREENLSAFVERIDATFARKLYVTADFYKRTNDPRAAVYHYRFLMKAFPDSPEAKQAEVALTKMPEWALKAAPTPQSATFVPTTKPSVD